MNLLILFWLNSDNFVGVIPNPMQGDTKKMEVIREWEFQRGYNKDSVMAIEYFMEINEI